LSASISTRIAAITVARRTALFILASLVTLTLATGILRTDFDTSLTALLTQSDPYLDEFDLFQQEFPNQLEVYYSFVAGPGLTVFDQTVLNAISSLESQYQDIPGAERLSSLVNYYSPEQQQRLFTKPLADYSQPELNTLRAVAVQDRLLTANLLSRDASLSTAIVSIDAEAASNAQRIDIANAVLAVRDRLRTANPELGIYANSDVLFEQSSQQAMIDDLTSLLPLIILVCVLVICYCFRSIVLGACILIHVLFTALTTIGALGYLGFSFNTISIIAPLVVVIIAVANSVHIISGIAH
jgi:uncharacterized protein